MSAAISSKILDCCSQQIAVSPDLIAFSTMSKFLMHNSEYTFEHLGQLRLLKLPVYFLRSFAIAKTVFQFYQPIFQSLA